LSNKEFVKLFSKKFNEPLDTIFPLELSGSQKKLLGTLCLEKGKISMIDRQGELLSGFPLAGTTAFCVAESGRRDQFVVITGNGDQVCAYSIQ